MQMELDYILPAKTIGQPLGGEVFFPEATSATDFALSCRASDHKFVYVDLQL